MGKNIAVVGAGISGLSCTYLLSEENYTITVFAKAFSPEITSNRAAAFWFPYHVRNDKRGITWAKDSFAFYEKLSADKDSGISMKQLIKVLRVNTEEEEPVWVEFIPEGACKKIPKEQLDTGFEEAYEILVPLIETQIFLPYLQRELEKKNVVFETKIINDLNDLSSFDVVINCSGLGARQLCHDETIYPVRGQVALIETDESRPIYLDNELPLYIVPRKDAMIVGGTYEEHVSDEKTEPATIEKILQTAYSVFPGLKQKKVFGDWAGLRPFRKEIRLEYEAGTNIIHNYGHGGSGFTLAFGCAADVVDLVKKI
ncbi:MAG: FAD-dependent oxidoreductase [Bacteroidetes bacterium]|nr:FAD-dependent oxidoreductase [Bacteroidota bacterium]